MSENPLLAALQESYGDGTPPPPDTSTVRGLLAFCKLWYDEEVEAEELHNPCIEMAGRLRGGARDTDNDLRNNPSLVDSARQPIARTAEAYVRIAEVLERIPELAAEENIEAYDEALEIFEEERQVVLDCNSEIEKTLSGAVRLCPRCGSQGGHLCPGCQLVRLYPDPRAAQYDRAKTAVLPPIYGELNQAYDSVMSGATSLETVFDAVAKLEDYLAELQEGYQQVTEMASSEDEANEEFREGQDLAHRLLQSVDRAYAGVDHMRGADETYRMGDLARGWEAIFDAAVEIQRATQRFARYFGYEEAIQEDTDQVQFSGE